MQRFLKLFGPLAIIVGAIEVIDGLWGLIDVGTWRAIRPVIPGTLLVVAGIFMAREARVPRDRVKEAAARLDEELKPTATPSSLVE